MSQSQEVRYKGPHPQAKLNNKVFPKHTWVKVTIDELEQLRNNPEFEIAESEGAFIPTYFADNEPKKKVRKKKIKEE